MSDTPAYLWVVTLIGVIGIPGLTSVVLYRGSRDRRRRLRLPHAFRVAGVAFLITMALGHLPALFALPAALLALHITSLRRLSGAGASARDVSAESGDERESGAQDRDRAGRDRGRLAERSQETTAHQGEQCHDEHEHETGPSTVYSRGSRRFR